VLFLQLHEPLTGLGLNFLFTKHNLQFSGSTQEKHPFSLQGMQDSFYSPYPFWQIHKPLTTVVLKNKEESH